MFENMGEVQALRAMIVKAQELGLKGVGAALTDHASKDAKEEKIGRVWDPLIVNIGKPFDNGIDYWGICMYMISEMLRTGKPAGTVVGAEYPAGEPRNPTGGLVIEKDNLRFYVAFAGGTEEQNVQVAQAGIDAFCEYRDEVKEAHHRLNESLSVLGNLLGFVGFGIPND
ncbi:MAG: hypothetical protein WC243_00480 [Patescibacteria group bacterium]|jgi:hypothetical protein